MESIVPARHWGVVIGASVRRVVVAAGFWGAIALPLIALSLLAIGGTIEQVALLVACNLGCLLIGHRHEPARPTQTGWTVDRPVGEGSR